MFTGIIEAVGTVVAAEGLGGGRRLTVKAPFAAALRPDQSVAINGACQTVISADEAVFDVVAVEETLRKTTLGRLQSGNPVNLERAMTPERRFDGHFVQGHVDATGTVAAVQEETTDRLYTIRFDEKFAPYLIPVGSVAVDGISLTVARLGEDTFTVAVIPHTYAHTNVPTWQAGASVNLEFDLLGKYVARQLAQRGGVAASTTTARASRGAS